MGKLGRRAAHRAAAVGVGALLAGSMFTGTASAQVDIPGLPGTGGSSSSPSSAANGGLQCSLLPLLAAQIQQLSSAAGALPLPGLPSVIPTNLQDAITQFNSLIPGCTASGGSNYDYAPGQPLKPPPGPPTPDFCPDDHHGKDRHGKDHGPDHGGYPGGGGTTTTAPPSASASANSAATNNPAGLTGLLPGTSGTTDATSGQGAGVPAAVPAAAAQPAAQGYAAQPGAQGYAAQPAAQGYAAQPAAQGYATNYGQSSYGQQGMGPGAQQAYGGAVSDPYAAAPYGSYGAYDGSYGGPYGQAGGGYYGDGYGYGHDGYKHDDHNPCGNGSDVNRHGKDDAKDYGQVNHVPSGSVNTGDGSTPVAVERVTG